MSIVFKKKGNRGFFDEDFRLTKLSKIGDPLERLNKGVDFELFRSILTELLYIEPKYKGGRPPYDYVMMFKILILQRYYNISDDQVEYQICDRLSFMRFLGLQLFDDVPDSKTIWNFRERMTNQGAVEKCFDLFLSKLESLGLVLNEGKIVDASFVEVPRQRNKKEENEKIKAGETPAQWELKPHKLSQKDLDARWTKKNNQTFFGYKAHDKVDSKSKLITGYSVTDASVHDSQPLLDLLNEKDENQDLYADSAYVGADLHEKLVTNKKVKLQICEKGYRGKPLTDEQRGSNTEKSRTRVRVEHVFGFIENSMNGSFIRTIGLRRATAGIGMIMLTYNMFRKLQIA